MIPEGLIATVFLSRRSCVLCLFALCVFPRQGLLPFSCHGVFCVLRLFALRAFPRQRETQRIWVCFIHVLSRPVWFCPVLRRTVMTHEKTTESAVQDITKKAALTLVDCLFTVDYVCCVCCVYVIIVWIDCCFSPRQPRATRKRKLSSFRTRPMMLH